MLSVYAIDIEDLETAGPLESWLPLLPEPLVQDVLSYQKPADRFRVLAGKLLLRYALSVETATGNLALLEKKEKGRPYIPDTDFDFNISHSGKYTVLATTLEGPCGIDIEVHRHLNIELFRRSFSDGEWEAITGAEDPHRIFFTCWAIKESVIKADGRGVAVLGDTEIHSHHHAICEGRTWYIRPLGIAEGYSAYIAYHRPIGNEIRINWVSAVSLTDSR